VVDGTKQSPIGGVRLAYTFDAKNAAVPSKHRTQYFEMMGDHAIYHEGWIASTKVMRPPWVIAGGERPEAEREARELEAFATTHYVPATIMASVWAALGDKDRTFAALRRVCQERDGAWGASVKVDPLYDGLRSDPR
jgi:arylsulfatase A-like enzyme